MSDVGGSAWGAPEVTESRVFVGTAGMLNYVIPHRAAAMALDRATGRPVWQFAMQSPNVPVSRETVPYGFVGSPALGADFVYFPALDGRLYAFTR